MAKQEATWVEVDIDSLAPIQSEAYTAYKVAYRHMKSCREQFEATLSVGVPAGKRMLFGYNFGKLSVAIVDDDRKPAKPQAKKQSLAEFLAAQADSGRRA